MRFGAFLSLALALAALAGRAPPPPAGPTPPPAPVTVATAGKKTVPVRVRSDILLPPAAMGPVDNAPRNMAADTIVGLGHSPSKK